MILLPFCQKPQGQSTGNLESDIQIRLFNSITETDICIFNYIEIIMSSSNQAAVDSSGDRLKGVNSVSSANTSVKANGKQEDISSKEISTVATQVSSVNANGKHEEISSKEVPTVATQVSSVKANGKTEESSKEVPTVAIQVTRRMPHLHKLEK